MARRRKRRIRWDRIAIAFVLLILFVVLLCTFCGHRGDETGDSSSAPLAPVSSQEQNSDVLPVQNQGRDYIVVLDAGHGGGDGGSTDGKDRFEKDDNLRLALAVRDQLETYPHITVIMTRETDVFVTLQGRCDIANEANADVFVSLHRNSATVGNGIEIWINNSDSSVNNDKVLANYILELLREAGISNDRGVRSGFRNDATDTNYYVNLHTKMPSCLVEMGFLTSSVDNQYFDERLSSYASAIAVGIVEYGTDKELYDGVV